MIKLTKTKDALPQKGRLVLVHDFADKYFVGKYYKSASNYDCWEDTLEEYQELINDDDEWVYLDDIL